jgi:hypothetical protein
VTSLIGPDGRIRSDDEALEEVTRALSSDAEVASIVQDIGSRHDAKGAFGLLIPARLRTDGRDVLIKVNATEHERRWLAAIAEVDPSVVPATFGDGPGFGDVSLGWMVVERLPFQPPGFGAPEWYRPLVRASFLWRAAGARVTAEPLHAIDGPWLTNWLDQAVVLDATDDLRVLRDRFDDDWAWAREVCGPDEPAHGDVHFFNAGSREPGVPEALVLFDPIPRSAPWPYDAANCETLTNYAEVAPGREPLVVTAARDRRERGLPVPDADGVGRLSRLWCAWLAVMWRVLFQRFAPERIDLAARYVERAVRA